MASVWFRCPVCGVQMQGDPRFPPLCPNSANHPRLPPGQLPQPVFVLPPRPPTWRERYQAYNRRRRSRAIKALGILFGIGLAFVVLGYAVHLVLVVVDPGLQSGPSPITEATFGGTIAAFQAKYGDPQPHGSGAARQWKVTINGIHVLVSVTPDSDTASDGQNHIIAMTIVPDGGFWSQSTAGQILSTFLPGDATYQKDQSVPGVGLARLYLSPDLGATFPASDFADSQGNLVSPGTFWAFFNPSLNGYVLKPGS